MRILLLASSFAAVAGCYNPAIENGGFGCNSTAGGEQCPSGYSCQLGGCTGANGVPSGADGCCVKSTGGTTGGNPMVMIPKSGPPYSGAKADPMLNSVSDCPDTGPNGLEPNDSPKESIGAPALTPDMPTAKIIKLAICPTGNNPLTGNHDVDFFSIDNRTGAASLTLMAQAFYDISMGDLDLAIYDSKMNLLSADGTAVTNACAAAAIGNDIYYIVVAGANNVDVNRYDLQIRSFSKAQTCPTM